MNNKNVLKIAVGLTFVAVAASFLFATPSKGADRRAPMLNRLAAPTVGFAPKLVGRVLLFNGVSKIKDSRIPKNCIVIFSITNPDQSFSEIMVSQVADDTILFNSLGRYSQIGPVINFSVYSPENSYDEFD